MYICPVLSNQYFIRINKDNALVAVIKMDRNHNSYYMDKNGEWNIYPGNYNLNRLENTKLKEVDPEIIQIIYDILCSNVHTSWPIIPMDNLL